MDLDRSQSFPSGRIFDMLRKVLPYIASVVGPLLILGQKISEILSRKTFVVIGKALCVVILELFSLARYMSLLVWVQKMV